ncbi:hypothetical protein, partial [Kitasatospora sp. NPDC001175]
MARLGGGYAARVGGRVGRVPARLVLPLRTAVLGRLGRVACRPSRFGPGKPRLVLPLRTAVLGRLGRVACRPSRFGPGKPRLVL